MDNDEFRKWAHRGADWSADYRHSLRDRAVRAPLTAGSVARQLDSVPPESPEAMETIFADFERIVVPGMTHWQHPRFFAYFPANASPASIVAEQLVAAMSAQCMLWQTSPAATEMETVMMRWLAAAVGLPGSFSGVIQDSASSATLAAVLTMRERALDWAGNRDGLAAHPVIRVYCSNQVHSSFDKAIWISGIGQANLVKIPGVGASRAIDGAALERAIEQDRRNGLRPAGIIACVGGTSVGASDDVAAVCATARKHGLYVHVDAAWAGAAMICPEFRHLWKGIEDADSVVFNPHKWLGAQFDCSAQFVRDAESLVKTLAIQPEYLKTLGGDGIINYSEWSVPLGRRFRALKIWFLLRAHGLAALRAMIRNHVTWSKHVAAKLSREPDFEIVTEPYLSLFTFRHLPPDGEDADRHNLAVVSAINDDGRIYLTQTRVDGHIAIRFQAGSFDMEERDAEFAFATICEIARSQRHAMAV